MHEEKRSHRERLRVQITEDDQRLIPLEWTDRYPRKISKAGALFDIELLIEVRNRLDGLLSAKRNPSQKQETGKEGSNEAEKRKSVAIAASRRKSTGDCALGTNSAKETEPGGEQA